MSTFTHPRLRRLRKSGTIQRSHVPQPEVSDCKIDKETGQLFTETIVDMQVGDDSFWEYQISNVKISRTQRVYMKKQLCNQNRTVNQNKGPRSLLSMALQKVICRVSDLNMELIQIIPLRLLEVLWENLYKRCIASFHVWSIFSVRLFRENSSVLGIRRHCQIITAPKSQLTIYIGPLTSVNYEFITVLAITNPFPVSDLVKLSKLVNLAALEIINLSNSGQSLVSDFLVRAWSLSASEDGAFKILQILRLWNHKEITHRSLAYLAAFPSLVIYDVRGCSLENHKSQRGSGWIYKDLSGSVFTDFKKSQQLEIDCLTRILNQRSMEAVPGYRAWECGLNGLIRVIDCLRNVKDLNKISGFAIDLKSIGTSIERVPIAYFHLGPINSFQITCSPSWFVREIISCLDDSSSSSLPMNQIIRRKKLPEPLFKSQRKPRLKTKRKLHELLEEFS